MYLVSLVSQAKAYGNRGGQCSKDPLEYSEQATYIRGCIQKMDLGGHTPTFQDLGGGGGAVM